MRYSRLIQIEFNHCDPAGIVFYPRYFEMTNSVVENFFADVVGRSFAEMHGAGGSGVPTAALSAEFLSPSRLGDKVLFSLIVEKVGRTSLGLIIEGSMGEELRMRARFTLVWVENMRPSSWPDDMRARLLQYQGDAI